MRSSRIRQTSDDVSFGGCLGAIILFVLFFLAGAALFTFAWNLLIPAAFNGPYITWPQGMAAIVVLWFLRIAIGGGRSS